MKRSFHPIRNLLLATVLGLIMARPGLAQKAKEGTTPAPAASAEKAKEAKLSSRAIYRRLLNSTGWIVTLKSNKKVASGTGWILDAKRRLMVTNHHVIAGRKAIRVFFPEFKDGELITDPKHYYRHITPAKGKVLDSDLKYDLAIIQLDKMPKQMTALDIAKASAFPSDRLHVVGGKPRGSDGLWTYGQGVARSVNVQKIATGSRIKILQTQDGSDRGNSGGAILNDAGKVVGVVEGGVTQARNVGINIDVSELRKYLGIVRPLLQGKSVDALVKLGDRHYLVGRFDAAIEQFNLALKKDAKSVKALTGRGWAFYKKRDKETAIADFDECIRLDPMSVDAFKGRAFVLRSQRKYKDAIKDVTRAIRIAPKSWSLYNLRANCYYGLRQYTKSIGDYDRAIKIAPTLAVLWANRGGSYMSLKQYGPAISDLIQALKLNGKDSEAWMKLGVCHFNLKNYSKADIAFRSAAKYSPLDPNMLAWVGNCKQRLNQHNDAITAFSAALKLRRYSYYYYGRSKSLAKLSRHKEALSDLNRAIALNPRSASYFFQRGLTRKALNDSVGASSDLKQAYKLDPKGYSFVRNGSLPRLSSLKPSTKSTQKRITSTQKRITTAKPSMLDGRWKFVGRVGRSYRQMYLVIKNGRYTFTDQERNDDGIFEQKVREMGTFKMNTRQLTLNNGKRSKNRRYYFKNGFMYVNFAEIGYNIPFSRTK